jgi:hypothetical protein
MNGNVQHIYLVLFCFRYTMELNGMGVQYEIESFLADNIERKCRGDYNRSSLSKEASVLTQKHIRKSTILRVGHKRRIHHHRGL